MSASANSYPSDLTDDEWEQIALLTPKPGRRGRPCEVDFREVINALSGALGLRLMDAADPLWPLADRRRLVP